MMIRKMRTVKRHVFLKTVSLAAVLALLAPSLSPLVPSCVLTLYHATTVYADDTNDRPAVLMGGGIGR